MKKLFYILLLLGSTYVFAQNKGMTYQAVIYAPGGQNVPGVNVANVPLANRTICLQFSLLDATSAIEYQEVVKIKTDEFGMVNITIGSGTQTGGYATSFAAVVWSASADKSMKVALDATGLCNQYEELSVEKLDAVPFANAAITAGNVSGVVALANGGTGATTAAGARTNLGIGNVDNTSDLNKPMSTATKTYIDSQLTNSTIVDADANTKGKIQLAGDLAGTAAAPTVPGLALKENAANKSTTTTLGTSNVLFPTQNAVKTYVDTAIAGATIVDADANTKGKIQLAGDLSGTAAAPTVPGLALKLDASLAGVPNGVATLNSAGIIPANQLPPVSIASTNVVSSQAQMLALSNATVGSIAVRTDVNKNFILSTAGPSVLANWIELLTPGAPVQSVNGLTGAIQLSKADINLANVDNTSDAAKPVSTATQNALNLKLNTNQVGVANGTASLNALGKIPTDQIPAISFSSVKVLGSQAEMLAQTNALIGSVVIRTDVNKNYVLAQSDPTILSNWLELLTPAPPVQSVNGYVGNVSLTKADLGLADVDNTGDINKPVSAPTQNALDLKANLASPTFTGTVSGIDKTMVGLGNVDNTTDAAKPVSTATQTALDLKANLASPTFTGTVSGIDKTMVGLGNVDNTTDAAKPVSTATQTALDLKANLASPTFTGTVSGIDKTMVGLGNVDNTTDAAKPVSTATQNALDLKANLASPTFTGTVSGITKSMVGLANVDNTTDLNKPVSTPTQTALDLKANLASPTFTGTVSGIDKTMVGLGNVDNTTDAAKPVSTATQTALDLKANLASPTFTGTVSGIDKTMVGLGSVDNTTDAAKPVSTATQTALDLKANLASPTFTGTVSGIDKTMVGLGSVDNTTDAAKPVSTATQTALDLKANLASPTFTGTVSGIDKTMVGLGNVDNTTDAAKPVSTATQTALDLKANLASPTFTGTVSGIDKTMVGLSNVDNTTDAAKPVSTATQTALDLKENAANKTLSVTTDGASDVKFPSAKAVKIYADAKVVDGIADAETTSAPTQNAVFDALALKENAANKSTATNLGATSPSDDLFPTQKAVKTYIDAQTAAAGVSDGSITSAKILDGTIAAIDIADNTITGAKLNSNLYAAGKTFTFQDLLVGAGTTFGRIATDGTKHIAFEPTYNVESTRFWGNGNITIQTGGTFTDNGYKLEVAGTTKFGGNATIGGTVTASGGITGTQFTSTIADGTAPFVVTSTTPVANLSIGGNAATVTTNANLTGDVTSSGNATTIGANKVVTGMIADTSVTNAKLDKTNIPLSGFGVATADVALGANKLTGVADPTLAQDAATKNYVDTATGAINVLADGKIYLGNASNVAAEVTPTGDVTMTNAGVTAIGTGKVVVGMLATDAVETIKIKDANVTYAKIQNVSATNKVLGRVTAGAGVVEEIATTGTGDVVRATSPTLVTPIIGAATGTSLSVSGQLISSVATGTAPLVVTSTTPVANLNIGGNAANVTGTVAIANGGTGAITAAAARTNLGLGNVDNTSDLNKPISTATQAALDFKQNALTNPITGTGTSNKLAKFSGTSTLTDSNITDNGTVVSIATDATVNSLTLGRGPGGFESNTVLGSSAFSSNTSGIDSAVLGFQALKNNTTGASNVAIGKDALFANIGGNNNVAIGRSSLVNNTTGISNVAIGLDSALSNTTGNENIAVGQSALRLNTTGVANTAIGRSALSAITTGNYNSALGWQSLAGNTTGIDNVAVGYNAGRYDTTGTTAMTTSSFSVYLGASTKGLNATGSVNETVIGNAAVGLGSNSTVIGNSTTTKAAIYGALNLPNTTTSTTATTGALTVAGGAGIAENLNVGGNAKITGTLTVAGGTPGAGKVLTSDANGLGTWSSIPTTNLASGVTGILPLANGGTGSATQNFVDLTTNQTIAGTKTFSSDIVVNSVNIGRGNGAITSNTAVGNAAISAATTGTDNSGIGYNALKALTSGNYNTAIGSQASQSLSSGADNTALGYQALRDNMIGGANTAIGKEALMSLSDLTSHSKNTAVGTASFKSLVTGDYNVGFGHGSLLNVTLGSNNVAFGKYAGFNSSTNAAVTSANNTIFIGADTKPFGATSTNEIVIGYAAVGLGNNSTVIGNSSITQAKVFGALNLPSTTTSTTATSGALTVGGGVGIAENLNVGGNAKITGTISIAGGTPGAGKVLTSDANGLGTWTTPAGVTTMAAIGITPNANGATISGVNLNLEPASASYGGIVTTGAQTFAGAKTFSPTLTAAANGETLVGLDINPTFTNGSYTGLTNYGLRVQGIGIGLGSGGITTNTAVGTGVLINNFNGSNNTGLGYLTMVANTSGVENTGIGTNSLNRTSTGSNNTAIGSNSGDKLTTGAKNIFVGSLAGSKIASSTTSNTTGANSVLIGYDVRPAADGETNEIVISGYNGAAGTIGKGSNTTTIGNAATTDTYINGNLNVTGQLKLTNAVLSKATTYAFLTTDNANLLVFSGSTAGQTITLPSAVTVGAGREITIKNVASVSVAIASAAGYLISDSSTTTATGLNIGVEPSNNWIKAISDGTNWIILRALF